MSDGMKIHSDVAWDIASQYSYTLASDTRTLAAQIDAALSQANERVAELEAVCQSMQSSAYAAVNPANWQVNNSDEERLKHYHETLDELSDVDNHKHVFERTFDAVHKTHMEQLAQARNEALEEAAAGFDGEAIHDEYGEVVSEQIRALKTTQEEG